MTEIEVKILEIYRPAVEQRLRDLGAVCVFDGKMLAEFWDDIQGSLAAAKAIVRLREEGEATVLTYKKPLPAADGTKAMQEVETAVSDAEAMRFILRQMGFFPRKTTQKHRTSYQLGEGVQVVFDAYGGDMSHIPEFIEIEAPDAETVYHVAAQLGFSRADCRNWNTFDLTEHYRPR